MNAVMSLNGENFDAQKGLNFIVDSRRDHRYAAGDYMKAALETAVNVVPHLDTVQNIQFDPFAHTSASRIAVSEQMGNVSTAPRVAETPVTTTNSFDVSSGVAAARQLAEQAYQQAESGNAQKAA